MRTFLNRSFLLVFVAWFLAANVGFSWTQSTCLFTGIQKASWTIQKSTGHPKETQIKRSTCFHFKHFQVKQHATFSVKKQALSVDLDSFDNSLHAQFKPVFGVVHTVQSCSASIPVAQSLRRALLQVYLI
jgi:hypothetical protein